jgi:hypothetical protein
MTGPAADSTVHDARLGAVSIAQPDSCGHVAWIAGLGYSLDELPLLVAFLQRAHSAASEAAARDGAA